MQGDQNDSDLTPEEWAELERLTAPETEQADEQAREQPEPAQAQPSAPDWDAIAAAATPPAEKPERSVSGLEELAPPVETTGDIEISESASSDGEAHTTQTKAEGPHPPSENTPSENTPSTDLAHAAGGESESAEAAVDAPPKMGLPRVIAVANQKGGVGKTTTTVNLAACLAEQGHRTLLVDLDPQANASTGVGIDSRQLEHSIYDVMLHDQPADSVIEPTEVKNLFVLPSSLDLAGAEIELVSLLSREHRLRLAIESVLDDFDYVLIDCPPSLGLLTINALTAAREVLVPIQCEYYALEGLGQLMRNVELVRASLNPTLQISHIVLVMFDPRTKLAGQVVDEVRAHFGAMVCQNVIPRTVRLSEAPSFGQPITTFDSGSRGAAAYRAVTQEVLDGQA